jgi:hypothetical protein
MVGFVKYVWYSNKSSWNFQKLGAGQPCKGQVHSSSVRAMQTVHRNTNHTSRAKLGRMPCWANSLRPSDSAGRENGPDHREEEILSSNTYVVLLVLVILDDKRFVQKGYVSFK